MIALQNLAKKIQFFRHLKFLTRRFFSLPFYKIVFFFLPTEEENLFLVFRMYFFGCKLQYIIIILINTLELGLLHRNNLQKLLQKHAAAAAVVVEVVRQQLHFHCCSVAAAVVDGVDKQRRVAFVVAVIDEKVVADFVVVGTFDEREQKSHVYSMMSSTSGLNEQLLVVADVVVVSNASPFAVVCNN